MKDQIDFRDFQRALFKNKFKEDSIYFRYIYASLYWSCANFCRKQKEVQKVL